MSTIPPISTPYLNNALTQIDGSPAQMHNCGLTVGACLANVWSLGYYQVKPAVLRTLSGVPNTSGTTYPQIINAVSKGTGGQVVLGALYWVAPSALDDALAAKRITGVMINCRVTINTPYHTGTYTGLHELEVVAVRTYNGQKQYLVMDPGKGAAYVTYQWWPASLLIAAAKAATYNGTLLLLLTRDLTNVTRTCVAAGPVRRAPSGSAAIAGQLRPGSNYVVWTSIRGTGWAAPAAASSPAHTAYGWSQFASSSGASAQFSTGLSVR